MFHAAKVRTKKHPTEEFSIGWELVGVLVGVLPFYKKSVGVLVENGGSFGVLVGVLVGVFAFLLKSGGSFQFFATLSDK